MVKRAKAKKAVINMRVRKSDLALIDQAARVASVTRSALIRHAAEHYARRTLAITTTQGEKIGAYRTDDSPLSASVAVPVEMSTISFPSWLASRGRLRERSGITLVCTILRTDSIYAQIFQIQTEAPPENGTQFSAARMDHR